MLLQLRTGAYYGPGNASLDILAVDIRCDGSEISLSQCHIKKHPHDMLCSHDQDVGVYCFVGMYSVLFFCS